MPTRPASETRVLVVDDADATRGRLSALLAEVDGVLVESCRPRRADVLRRVTQARPHCLVLDVATHDTEGFELLALLRKLNGGDRIVVLTRDPSDEFRRHCRHLGADHLFDKAGEFENLLELVAAIAARP